MHCHLLTALLAAAQAATAAVITERADYNIIQLRLYAVPDCPAPGPSLGEWTVHNATGEVDTCLVLQPDLSGVDYLSIIEMQASSDPAWANCTTTLYTDATCTVGGSVLTLGECADAPAGSPGWGSFEVLC